MTYRRSFYSQESDVGTNITQDGDLAWKYAMTPRKWRTIFHTNQFQPTSLYTKQIYRPTTAQPQHAWIGLYYIPSDSIPKNPSKLNYVTEYDVMKSSGMYSYRILYAVKDANGSWYIKSKPSVEGRPGQLNLILSTDNKILNVQYW